jgi:hypothetical protein
MAYNTVKLKNYSNVFIEGTANAAISPGMLIELMSTDKWRAHATAGGNAVKAFALENYLEGKDINDAYAAADEVQIWLPTPGDEVYALIADEQNIAIGDFLESNGSGYLQKHASDEASEGSARAQMTVYPLQIVGQALEALDLTSLSAAGSSDTPNRQFCKIRIV